VLVKLREYMRNFYPDHFANDGTPLAFWEIEDADLFVETLGYLPLFMGDIADDLAALPLGYRLAYPVFWLEDDYQFNGWTALGNAGDELLAQATAAYRHMGMETEARALDAARAAVLADPDDEDAHEAAYKSVVNPLRDDDARVEALQAWFCAHRGVFLP
jgi:hypothetical protein